ncbi:hypothetical protein LCGC14_1429160 [marine sediment metagenome]|uniref:Uncharacterized protein n=1 Tax=marine sediment metagenome TaxID=412755 RepID=A0A0F9M4J5_9ZZZZ
MAAIKLKWSSLLRLTDLEFEPEAPKVLSVSDELIQSLSWLTGATLHDRRLLRCNELGALLVGNAWDNLSEVETDELNPADGVPDSYTATVENKGVLIATSTQIVKIDFVRVSGGDTETVYISPSSLYFYPHTIYSVTATVVPASGGTASYVGITTFN